MCFLKLFTLAKFYRDLYYNLGDLNYNPGSFNRNKTFKHQEEKALIF